jgi:hypothetical protein
LGQEAEQRARRHLGQDVHLVLAEMAGNHPTALGGGDPSCGQAGRRFTGQQCLGRCKRR